MNLVNIYFLDTREEKHEDGDVEIIQDVSSESSVKEYEDVDMKIVNKVSHNQDDESMPASEDTACEEMSDDSDIKVIEDVTIEQCKETESSEKTVMHSEKSDFSVTNETSEKSDKESHVYKSVTTVTECGKDSSVNEAKEVENIVSIEEIIDIQNQNMNKETENDIVIQEEFIVQTEPVELNESVSSVPEIKFHKNVAGEIEHVIQPKQIGNSETPTTSVDVYDFQKDISSASRIPAYVPIRERISRTSYKDTSGFQTFKELEDTSCGSDSFPPSLIKQPVQDDIAEIEKTSSEEHLPSSEPLPQLFQEADVTVTKVSSSDNMEVEESAVTESAEYKKFMSTPSSTSSKEYFTQRFDFLSKNSDMYESNKLYKETMNVLKESDPSENVEMYGPNKSRQTKTFVFSKEGTKSSSKSVKKISSKDSNSKWDDERPVQKEFLESWNPESYEQFSSSFAKGEYDFILEKHIICFLSFILLIYTQKITKNCKAILVTYNNFRFSFFSVFFYPNNMILQSKSTIF